MSPAQNSSRIVAVMLALMIAATICMALLGGPMAGPDWALVAVHAVLALLGGSILLRNLRRDQQASRQETARTQALLERLSIATQASGIYCWQLDWNTYQITWDERRLPASETAPKGRRHYGYELGKELFKYVHPEDAQAGSKAITAALENGEDLASFRYRLVLPDGTVRHVQAYARTTVDAARKPQRSIGVSWDITQEVVTAELADRAASIQRQLLERLSVATQAAGLKCWEYDFTQNRITWIEAGPDQAELSPDEVQRAGEALLDRIVPEDLRTALQRRDEATQRGEPMVSTRVRQRESDGTLRHIQMYMRFSYDADGRRLRALCANLDITESFQRQIDLEALSIRFDSATRAARAGVWEWREDTDEVWWNEMTYAIYGQPIDTYRPTMGTAISLIHPDDLPLAQAAWENALLNTGQLRVQFRILKPDGSIAHVEQIATLVKDSLKSGRRMVGIALDISQRLAAEQRERQLQKKLREASHQSGMAEVATGVLHNVGNVLNSLGVASATAQSRLKLSQFDRVERVAALIEEHRDHLAEFLTRDPRGQRLPEYLRALGTQLVKDAADVGQEIDALNGHLSYLREIVRAQQNYARVGHAEEIIAVDELIDSALSLQGRDLKGIEIVRDVPELPELKTNRYKLMQILVNFIGNARDALASEELPRRRITIRAGIVGEQLEIAVEDTGVGIAAQLLPRVWEFGFTTKAHGHGFGLHSTAVAAQELGGSVAARSAGPGHGACFSVRLPIDASAARSTAERSAAG